MEAKWTNRRLADAYFHVVSADPNEPIETYIKHKKILEGLPEDIETAYKKLKSPFDLTIPGIGEPYTWIIWTILEEGEQKAMENFDFALKETETLMRRDPRLRRYKL